MTVFDLLALLSPQTGEGECEHDQEGAFKKHCPDCGEQNLCYYCIDKHKCSPISEEMEKDFLEGQEFYELMQVYRHTPIQEVEAVTKAFETVKAFLRKQLDLAVSKAEKRMIEELTKELKWHRKHQDRAKGMSMEQMSAFLEGLTHAIVLLHHPNGEIEWTHIKDKIIDITSVNHSKQGL